MTADLPGQRVEYLSVEDASELLDVHYMTAYRYVRSGRLHATRSGGRWQIDPEDLIRFQTGSKVLRPRRGVRSQAGAEVGPRVGVIADALLAGDSAVVWHTIQDSFNDGYSPTQIYLGLMGGALKIVGDRWESGEASIAEEHCASVVAMRTIGVLGDHYRRPGRTRGSVVLAAAPGDRHGLPTAIVADLLRQSGFAVTDLGADVPAEQLALAVRREDRLRAVGVCATTPLDSSGERDLRDAIHLTRTTTDCPILVGGAAIISLDHGLGLGADLSFEQTEQLLGWFADLGPAATSVLDPAVVSHL